MSSGNNLVRVSSGEHKFGSPAFSVLKRPIAMARPSKPRPVAPALDGAFFIAIGAKYGTKRLLRFAKGKQCVGEQRCSVVADGSDLPNLPPLVSGHGWRWDRRSQRHRIPIEL